MKNSVAKTVAIAGVTTLFTTHTHSTIASTVHEATRTLAARERSIRHGVMPCRDPRLVRSRVRLS